MKLKGTTVSLLCVAVFLRGALALAEEISSETVFLQANEAYRQERFPEAMGRYQAILDRGMENGALYYNLGNTLLKTGQKSQALWAYLKAGEFLPRDADVAANLEYVQSLLASGTEASMKPPRLVRWLARHGRLTTSELAGWFCALLWLAALCWTIVAWWPLVRPVLRPCAWVVSLVAGLLLTALMAQTVWIDGVSRGVVIEDRVEAKFAPQATGTTHFTLPEGTLVRLLGQEFGWAQIKRADGRTGWVPSTSLKALAQSAPGNGSFDP